MSDAGDAAIQRGSRMGTLVGSLLLLGVLASATFILAGWLWHWISSGQWAFDYTLPRTNLLRFFRQEIRAAAHGNVDPRLLVNWGIIFLFMTPYLRVLLSFIYFLIFERNWKYSALTGFVLAALTLSLTVL